VKRRTLIGALALMPLSNLALGAKLPNPYPAHYQRIEDLADSMTRHTSASYAHFTQQYGITNNIKLEIVRWEGAIERYKSLNPETSLNFRVETLWDNSNFKINSVGPYDGEMYIRVMVLRSE